MMQRKSITHLNAQPSVCGIKNLRFLDNTLFEAEGDILDNETSDVAAAKDATVEMRTLILQPTIPQHPTCVPEQIVLFVRNSRLVSL